MPRFKMTLDRLLIELRDSFPTQWHVPEDRVELSFSHAEGRALYSELVTVIVERSRAMKQALVLSYLLGANQPELLEQLIRSGFIDREPVKPNKVDIDDLVS